MSDTFSSTTAANADTTLPPLTAALRKVWQDAGPFTAAVQAVAFPPAMRAILDAVNSLERRVLTLEGTPFP
ncbi:hypothetical protein ACWDNI_16070 [Nocardia niigatensis]